MDVYYINLPIEMPAWTIGKSKRCIQSCSIDGEDSKDVKVIPGPGRYAPVNMTYSEDSPKWSMGKSKRDGFSSSNKLPGPGSYKFNSTVL